MFDLERAGDTLAVDYRVWVCALSIAIGEGRVPQGAEFDAAAKRREWEAAGLTGPDVEAAVAEEESTWSGGYVTNDLQVVSAADAAALADALAQAAHELPPAGTPLPKPTRIDLPMGDHIDFSFASAGGDGAIDPREPFLGEGELWLEQIIAFCRRGSFSIR
jgi:hypothetical protein